MAFETNTVTSETRLSIYDILVVVGYFVAVVAVGLYASCRSAKGSVSAYFLAGRQMNFIMVGASLFVSNIGSEHFIGLAGSGAAGGIGVGAWEFNAVLLLQLLGFVFVPVYIASKVYTMPQYLNKRFGGQRIRVYFAVLSLVLYIFTKCSVNLYTGALFLQQSLGWDMYLSIFIMIVVVAVLTVTGGLTAVIYTDTLQAILMVVGACVLTILGFNKVGGFDGLWRSYPHAVPNMTLSNYTCSTGEVNKYWNVMLREPNDPDMPWPGFLFGQTPGSIWYWCSDQVIVQRALAAKSLSHAQGATILAGFIKILPLFIMVMPGMISRVLYPDAVACVDPDICYSVCQSRAGCTNIAFPKLVLGIMPEGLRGLMMAVIIAALMSDLDSIFNSASTLFTIDIWTRFRKQAGVKEQLVVGRVFLVCMAGIAIAWVPVVKEMQGGQVFIYIQEVTNYLAPPVACVYLISVLWPRCNEKGAFWGLMAGLVTGVTRLVLIFVYRVPETNCDEDLRPDILKNVHYMYFAMLLFWITFLVTIVVSLFTDPPPYKHLYRTTFWTRFAKEDREDVDEGRIITSWDRLNCCVTTSGSGAIEIAASLRNQSTLTHAHTFDNPAIITSDDVDISIPHERNSGTTWTEIDLATDKGKKIQTSSNELDSHSQTNETKQKQTCKEFLVAWLCGVEHKMNQEETNKAETQEEKVSSLEQDPIAKIFLYFMCMLILMIGVALYCFWSLWKYEVVDTYSPSTAVPATGL